MTWFDISNISEVKEEEYQGEEDEYKGTSTSSVQELESDDSDCSEEGNDIQ